MSLESVLFTDYELPRLTRREWVSVCWEGVTMPAADDFIALYVPANADITLSSPVKYQWAALTPTHLTLGSGCLK